MKQFFLGFIIAILTFTLSSYVIHSSNNASNATIKVYKINGKKFVVAHSYYGISVCPYE